VHVEHGMWVQQLGGSERMPLQLTACLACLPISTCPPTSLQSSSVTATTLTGCPSLTPHAPTRECL
jgi:hypothetical protein